MKNHEEDKEKERAMLKRLGELNQEFRDIKKMKKMPETILKSKIVFFCNNIYCELYLIIDKYLL